MRSGLPTWDVRHPGHLLHRPSRPASEAPGRSWDAQDPTRPPAGGIMRGLECRNRASRRCHETVRRPRRSSAGRDRVRAAAVASGGKGRQNEMHASCKQLVLRNDCFPEATIFFREGSPPEGAMSPRSLRDPDVEPTNLQLRAANLLGALAVGLVDAMNGAVQRSLECSEAGVAALLWIHRAPGLRNEELSDLLGMCPSSAGRLVSRLVAEGLVLREADPGDGRAIRLRTSELGARRALMAAIARGEVTRSLVEGLPGVLIPRLVRIAERLLTAMADGPRTGLRICRFCHWAACRNDETAPCPVVLATTTPRCPSGPPIPGPEGGRF
jgi:MarR family transcriptional regulator, negative regulator of the multidrug operon emrRAB